MKTYTGTVKWWAKPFINIRDTPDGNDLGDLPPLSPITGDEIVPGANGYSWMHILSPQAGWVRTDFLDYYQPGGLVYVKRDTKPRNRVGDPATYKCLSGSYTTVTPEILEYMKSIQKLASPGLSEKDFERNFASLWKGDRAFSNKRGYESGNFGVEAVYTTGATFRAVTGKPFFKRLGWWLEVYAIDPNKLPPVPARVEDIDWTLHFRPTIATAVRYGSSYRTNPFPQFGGNSIIPFFGINGRNAIQKSNLDFLTDTEQIGYPYYP